LVYDSPYAPPIVVLVTLHCVKCKTPKVALIHISPGVKPPRSILPYNCSRCSPRIKRDSREKTLAKKNPLAYGSWRAMIARCTFKYATGYEHYGGRGITICPRWLHEKDGFANFVQDLGERTPELSIDRINVDGNYTPENCRWATAKEQRWNQRCMSDEDRKGLAEMENEFANY